VPTQRLSEVEDVANAFLFLASSESGNICGLDSGSGRRNNRSSVKLRVAQRDLRRSTLARVDRAGSRRWNGVPIDLGQGSTDCYGVAAETFQAHSHAGGH